MVVLGIYKIHVTVQVGCEMNPCQAPPPPSPATSATSGAVASAATAFLVSVTAFV
jgi:hypothetical protein